MCYSRGEPSVSGCPTNGAGGYSLFAPNRFLGEQWRGAKKMQRFEIGGSRFNEKG
jgi:hypothetical protein